MKPQLLGFHNLDLVKTGARLIKGASYKRQRIIVILPAIQPIAPKVCFSLWNLGFPPNNAVFRLLAEGMEVGEAYSSAIEQILNHPELSTWEYILTIEHDNIPPGDGVIKLLETMEAHKEYDCVSGLYFTKGEGGVAQIWGDVKDPVFNMRPQIPYPNQLIECNGTGMGFALWKLKMFKDARLRKPWFKTLRGNEGFATQDLYAWSDFRKHGYRCAVDCSVKVGHYDINTDIIW